VAVERAGVRVTVTLQRPEVRNALDEALIAELQQTFDTFADDATARVIVLAGSGPVFCAGADVNWMARARDLSPPDNDRDAAALARLLRTVAECPLPVVARVHGGAFGGGAGLVAAADIAIAADDAQFAFPEVRLGFVPAVIAPHVIDRIGAGHARALFLSGERFDAGRAQSIGLVHRVVPAGELDSAVDDVSSALLAGGPEAQRNIKALLRELRAFDAASVDARTSGLTAAMRVGDEAREGVRAFFEKRSPRWPSSPSED
jgi:methylglutaconyl-CoA hydratase